MRTDDRQKQRQALLEGADFIEKNPDKFEFFESTMPRNETDCGCALGWAGYFLSDNPEAEPETHAWANYIGQIFADADTAFYRRLEEIEQCMRRHGEIPPEIEEEMLAKDLDNWMDHAGLCAMCMRVYADKFYPEEEMVNE